MQIDCGGFRLRPWLVHDAEDLVEFADNRKIWRNLSDAFPSPYTREAAESWVAVASVYEGLPTRLVIEVEGRCVGAVGTKPKDGEQRRTSMIGYWLAESYWGRGIATAALSTMVDYAFARFPLDRLEANVFEWNPASCRVLEKAGFVREARLRKSVLKDGQLIDSFLYARLRDGLE